MVIKKEMSHKGNQKKLKKMNTELGIPYAEDFYAG